MSFLRETLTILAVLLVLALTAALAAPLFIDWSSHRLWVEERLSEALGGEVKAAGAIDVRLLPAPRLDVSGVSWRAAGEGALRLEADRVQLEVAVAPLLQGVVRFVEARLERPRLSATLAADAGFALPQTGDAGGVVAFERIEIRNGEVALARAGGETLRVSGLDIDADAASLLGPFRGSGSYAGANGRAGFRLSAGVAEDDKLRVKFTTEPAPGAPQFDLDGNLIAERSGAATRLRFEGAAAVWGSALAEGVEMPWRAAGALAADAERARLEPMELRFGPLERQATATGAASFDAGSRALTVALSAPQVDADRLLDSKDAAGEAMARLSRVIAGAFARSPHHAAGRAMSIKIDASAPALLIGGDTVTDAMATIDLPESGVVRLAFSANLPGRARISFDGLLEGGAAARIAGKAQAGARDLPRLAQWLERADPDVAERLRGSPFRIVEAAGDVEISRHAFSGRNLDIRADRSKLTGAVAFTRALPGEPARLFADLTSPALDLDGVPNLSGGARALRDVDLNLSIDARAVRVAGVGGGIVDSGRIRGRLTRAGGRLELERLSVENLGGATLNLSGRVGGDNATLEGRLEAQRLVELAALVRRVAPGPLSDLLNERAVALSPARIDMSADAVTRDGAVEVRAMRIQGAARGTSIAAAVRPAGDQVEAEVELSSNDTPMLLRQLGFDAVPIRSAPRSRLTVRARGALDAGYDAEGGGDIAGASVSFAGKLGARAGGYRFEGRGRIATKDATPLMQVLAVAWRDAQAAIPLDVSGEITLDGKGAGLRALGGAFAGARIGGSLRFATDNDASRRALTGSLSVDRMSFDTIAGLALGAPASDAKSASLWSDRPFAPGIADPPPTDVQLRVGEMNVRGLTARGVAGRLVLGQGAIALEGVSARFGESEVSGRLALRRDKAEASLAASLDVKAPIDLRDQIAAKLSARVDLAATGRSERGLVSTLAGAGRARLTDVVIPRADPNAVDSVVALVEKDAIAPDERAISAALQKAFERGPLRAGALDVDLLAASGVLRFQPVKVASAATEISLAGAIDLRSLSTEQSVEIVSRTTPPKWTDPNPRVRLVWAGAPGRAARSIDAAALVNGLSARAILRESARIEALEADIRERAMFNRRLRADEWRRRREAEIRAFLAEQEKQEALRLEAERRAQEAEQREREKQEKLRQDAEQRAQERQRLLDELMKPVQPPVTPQSAPLQLPGAAPR